METIVKYSNRKLYSNTLKKYVNLTYVLDVVKGGQDVVVKDYVTGTDITSQTLTTALVKLKKLDQKDLKELIRQ